MEILEEPPEQTVFLLVTNDQERLLTTILSRTQIVQIRDFRDNEIAGYLVEKHQLDESRAMQLAQIASGDLNEAIKLANATEDDTHTFFRDWMRSCWNRKYADLVKMGDAYSKLNKISQKGILQYGLNLMRESLVFNYQKAPSGRLMGNEREFLENFARVMDIGEIEAITKELNDAFYHLERNANTKILFMDTSILISQAFVHKRMGAAEK